MNQEYIDFNGLFIGLHALDSLVDELVSLFESHRASSCEFEFNDKFISIVSDCREHLTD